jgi:hypothetical protein
MPEAQSGIGQASSRDGIPKSRLAMRELQVANEELPVRKSIEDCSRKPTLRGDTRRNKIKPGEIKTRQVECLQDVGTRIN